MGIRNEVVNWAARCSSFQQGKPAQVLSLSTFAIVENSYGKEQKMQ